MATVYTYENPATDALGPVTGATNGVRLSAATVASRVLFNDSGALNSVTLTSTFVNTRGVTLSSGTGKLVYDTTYANDVVYFILPDRSSFAGKLPNSSGTISLTANDFEAWGPTERRLRLLEYI
jgi:hypothetical protein